MAKLTLHYRPKLTLHYRPIDSVLLRVFFFEFLGFN